ncbi:MAG TPA: hypothetical protein VF796_06165 [Humisphaera sp.]
MTTNQTRAVVLAREILGGRVDVSTLSDQDWVLLVLAAGVSCTAAGAVVVSSRVLENASAMAGYFGTATQFMPTRSSRVLHA